MRKPSLASIYAMMTERQQAQGFAEHVKALIADGSVEKAGAFFNALCQVEGCDYAKTAVGSELLSGYLATGELEPAIATYRYMEALHADDEILRIRANALLALVPCLLPDQDELALNLWERLVDSEPPLESLYAVAKVGIEILKLALASGDEETRDRIYRRLYPDRDVN